MGLFGGSKASSEDNKRQVSTTASDQASVSNLDISGTIKNGAEVIITDAGAIAGNVSVANNALVTAGSIVEDIGDTLAASQTESLGVIKGVTDSFSNSLESLKKAELTNGSSLFFDAIKFWPVIPVAVIIYAYVIKGSR